MSIGLATMAANQSPSREVNGNSSPPGSTWAMCWLMRSTTALWIIFSSALRGKTVLVQVDLLFGRKRSDTRDEQTPVSVKRVDSPPSEDDVSIISPCSLRWIQEMLSFAKEAHSALSSRNLPSLAFLKSMHDNNWRQKPGISSPQTVWSPQKAAFRFRG